MMQKTNAENRMIRKHNIGAHWAEFTENPVQSVQSVLSEVFEVKPAKPAKSEKPAQPAESVMVPIWKVVVGVTVIMFLTFAGVGAILPVSWVGTFGWIVLGCTVVANLAVITQTVCQSVRLGQPL